MNPRLRSWVPWGLVAAGVVATALLVGNRGGEGAPLDPTSPKRLGTKGLVEVLRALGADVQVTMAVPEPGEAATVLVLADDLDEARREGLVRWVDAGGTLVLADAGSPLNPFEVRGGTQVGLLDAELDKRCELAALRDVRRVSAPAGVVLEAPTGALGCFPRNDGHWLVTGPAGRGRLVVLGGAGAFVNARLDDADNGLVAASLLAPRPGGRVVFLRPPPPGGGDEGLLDLMSPTVKTALAQVAVAFVALVLWRARRLGRPVLEPQPVQLAASELVTAVGNLLQRAGRRDRAAALLRDDLRRDLAERLGLPASTPPDVVAEVAAVRAGVRADEVAAALAGPPPGSEAGLVALARLVESVREEVLSAKV